MNKILFNECLEILRKLTTVSCLDEKPYSENAVNLLLDLGVESTKDGLVGIDDDEFKEIAGKLLNL